MKGTLIFVLVVAAAVALWWFEPWAPKRYDETPAGVRAEKIDDHIDFFREWRPPQTWEARDYLGSGPPDEKAPPRYYGVGDWDEAKALVDELYAAGAQEVSYINVKRSVKFGDEPEGLFVILPEEPAQRQPVFTAAGKGFQRVGQTTPPDVNQKYLYFGFGAWDPDDPEPGWLPE